MLKNEQGSSTDATTEEIALSILVKFADGTRTEEITKFSMDFGEMDEEEIKQFSNVIQSHHSKLKEIEPGKYTAKMATTSIYYLLRDLSNVASRLTRKGRAFNLAIERSANNPAEEAIKRFNNKDNEEQ